MKEIEIPEGYEARIEGNKVILEPKESEDERIRKWLVAELHHEYDMVETNTIHPEYADKRREMLEKCIAWLEKHKVIVMHTPRYAPLEKKPAEWSKEDERMLNSIIHGLDALGYAEFCGSSRDQDAPEDREYYEEIEWLKSLRPQPKGETYKSAKHDLAIRFMNYLDENRPDGEMSLSSGECEDIDKAFKENDWAKIIRYAEKYSPSWKPSEEQMEALQTVYEYLSTSTPENIKLSDILRGLYNDIK